MASKRKYIQVSSNQMSRVFYCYDRRSSSILDDMGLKFYLPTTAIDYHTIWSYEIIDEKKFLLTILKHNLNYTITEND